MTETLFLRGFNDIRDRDSKINQEKSKFRFSLTRDHISKLTDQSYTFLLFGIFASQGRQNQDRVIFRVQTLQTMLYRDAFYYYRYDIKRFNTVCNYRSGIVIQLLSWFLYIVILG